VIVLVVMVGFKASEMLDQGMTQLPQTGGLRKMSIASLKLPVNL
jgi:hypothetical protein